MFTKMMADADDLFMTIENKGAKALNKVVNIRNKYREQKGKEPVNQFKIGKTSG